MAVTTRNVTVGGLLGALVMAASAALCLAQEPPPAAAPEVVPAPAATEPVPEAPEDYGRVEAGQESYERAEAQRQAAVQRQVELNEDMRWYSGLPGYYRYPPSVAAIYAWAPGFVWGPRRAARYAAVGPWGIPAYFPYPAPQLRAYRSVFEPWPMVPGRIVGYPYAGWVPQPRGQVEVQIGPGVILSRPDYGPGAQAPQGPTPAPPQAAAEPIPAPAPAGPALPELNPPEPPAPAVPPDQPGLREF